MKKLIFLIILGVGIIGCTTDSIESETIESYDAKAKANTKVDFDIPEINCTEATENTLAFEVVAGESGAPEGFNLRWMTAEEHDEYGWDEAYYCEKNFQANPSNDHSLEPGESYSFNLEDLLLSEDCSYMLECGMNFVFTVRANGGNQMSEWSAPFACSTLPCETVCTYGKGFWKNHSSDNPGDQENYWPVDVLTLGETEYNQEELNEIMDLSNNEGNNLIIFSQHLIAAKLNVANGADPSEVEDAIIAADELLGELVILADEFTSEQKDAANDLKEILEAYNEGETGPGNCDGDDDDGEDAE